MGIGALADSRCGANAGHHGGHGTDRPWCASESAWPAWRPTCRRASSVGAGQQWPHEGPFIAEHAAAVVPDAVRFDEVRVGAEQGAVLLVGSQTGGSWQDRLRTQPRK